MRVFPKKPPRPSAHKKNFRNQIRAREKPRILSRFIHLLDKKPKDLSKKVPYIKVDSCFSPLLKVAPDE